MNCGDYEGDCICDLDRNHEGPHKCSCGNIWGTKILVLPTGVRYDSPDDYFQTWGLYKEVS